MRHRIAENAQPNRRAKIARDLRPFFEIDDCVAIGGVHVSRIDDIEDTTLARRSECRRSG